MEAIAEIRRLHFVEAIPPDALLAMQICAQQIYPVHQYVKSRWPSLASVFRGTR